MRQYLFPLGPVLVLDPGLGCIYSTHYALGPLGFVRLGQFLYKHSLHEAMHAHGFRGWLASDERIRTQGRHGFIEGKWVIRQLLQARAELVGTGQDDGFRQGVGGEMGAETQQVGGSLIALLNTLKGQRPGGGDWFGMMLHQAAAFTQQVVTTCAITRLVLGEATGNLFDIRARLVQRQWQTTKFIGNRLRQGDIGGRGGFKRRIFGDEVGATQQQ